MLPIPANITLFYQSPNCCDDQQGFRHILLLIIEGKSLFLHIGLYNE